MLDIILNIMWGICSICIVYLLYRLLKAIDYVGNAIMSYSEEPISIELKEIDGEIFKDYQSSQVKRLEEKVLEMESDFNSRMRKYYAKFYRLGLKEPSVQQPEVSEIPPDGEDEPLTAEELHFLQGSGVPTNGQTPKDAESQVQLFNGQQLKPGQRIEILPINR